MGEYDIFASLNEFIENEDEDQMRKEAFEAANASLNDTDSPTLRPSPTKKTKRKKKSSLDDNGAVSNVGENGRLGRNGVASQLAQELDIMNVFVGLAGPSGRRTGRGRRGRSRGNPSNIIMFDPYIEREDAVTVSSINLVDEGEDKKLNDDDYDSVNREISIKVKWFDKIQKFQHRAHQKFRFLSEKIAAHFSVEAKHLILILNDVILHPDDTPESVNYGIADFIYAHMRDNSSTPLTHATKHQQKLDEYSIEIKIQSEITKKPLILIVNKTETFKLAVVKCAEELNINFKNLQFIFDGEIINLNLTPNDLEFEGGEIIDLKILKK